MSDPDGGARLRQSQPFFRRLEVLLPSIVVILGLIGSGLYWILTVTFEEIAQYEVDKRWQIKEQEFADIERRLEKTHDKFTDDRIVAGQRVSDALRVIEIARDKAKALHEELQRETSRVSLAVKGAETVVKDSEALVTSLSGSEEFREMVRSGLHSIPAGAVVSFNLDKCPIGWGEYDKAYGVFIRGIDKGVDKKDPDGERKRESLQEDILGDHFHTFRGAGAHGLTTADRGGDRRNLWHSGDYKQDANRKTSIVGGIETRPKNIALLYCVKVFDEGHHSD